MAAIEPNRRSRYMGFSVAALLFVLSAGSPLQADRAGDLRSRISELATSLTSGNAARAMAVFDASYSSFEKLQGYFQGLTGRQIENEVDVTDERDSPDGGVNLTLSWDLTLTDLSTNRTEHRSAEITAHLVSKKGKWMIVEFSPIDIFDPLSKRLAKH